MEKRLQLWSPVWGWLATKEGESVDLKGQDLVLYETAIQEALEQEKLYYRKKSAPFNLMDYYDADDSVKEKVQNLDIQVKKEQEGLYVCASLALKEPLGLYATTPGAFLRIKKFSLAYLQYGNIKVASHPCGRTLASLKLPL